jgi:hypothetical protein
MGLLNVENTARISVDADPKSANPQSERDALASEETSSQLSA